MSSPLSRCSFVKNFDLGMVNERKQLEFLIPSSLDDLSIKLKKGRHIIPQREIHLPLTQRSRNQAAVHTRSCLEYKWI